MASHSESPSEWDASWPGTGAQRCTAITQLYFRMANYPSLTLLVVDALCLVFNDSGATQSELEAYLGLSDDRVRFALACIPDSIHCTSKNLPNSDIASSVAKRLDEDTEVVHYLNYKKLIPLAYAHVTRILLSLSLTPLPPSATTNGMSSDTNNVATAVNLSRKLVRQQSAEGILCRSCRFYHALADFEDCLATCPTCGEDVLAPTLKTIKDSMDAKCAEGKPLALPPTRAVAALTRSQKTPSDGVPGSPNASSPVSLGLHGFLAASPRAEFGIDCPLARDPFLVQQALVFFYLYTDRLAFVSDDTFLVTPEDILSEPEYRRRLQGRASVADLFRAAHRNPASIRVKVVSQKEVDAARTADNERKLAKRANLPPWLRPRSAASLLGPNVFLETTPHEVDTGDVMEEDPRPITPAPNRTDQTVLRKGSKRAREDTAQSSEATQERSDVASCRATASFIATSFFYDDFDPVPLPRHRRS